MKYLKIIQEWSSESRRKELDDTEFLEMLHKNCKNFSFDNDQLFRVANSNMNFSFFEGGKKSQRKTTFGNYGYTDFLKNIKYRSRKEFPVIRQNSLIGKSDGCKGIVYASNCYTIIPFDNIPIIFGAAPDIGMLFPNNLYSDFKQAKKEDFILKNYDKNFKIPNVDLEEIYIKLKDRGSLNHLKKQNYFGWEFFTDHSCLLIHEDKIGWLKEILELSST